MQLAAPYSSIARLWRRALASHVVRLLVFCVAFCALLAAGFHSGRDFANALQAMFANNKGQTVAPRPFGVAARPDQPARLQTVDAAGEFAQERVGELLISSRNSDHCTRVLFNNRTGEMSDVGISACGLLTEAGDTAVDRAEVLRRSFRK
jgi:hypothetical protein